MGKGKRFSLYLLLTLLALAFLYLGAKYGVYLKLLRSRTYDPYPYYIFSAMFPILFGMVLALPNLWREFRKPGKWTMDWVKLLAIGIPTLLVNLNLVLIALTPVGKIKYFTTYNPFIEVMITDKTVIALSGTIFGYVLISSFNKKYMELYDSSKTADFT